MALQATASTAILLLALATTVPAQLPRESSTSGREAYREECLLCHRLRLPPPAPRTCEEWKRTVARMSEHRQRIRKEPILEADQSLIASYLASLRD